MGDNYPLGAKYDPYAPYNQKDETVKVKVLVSVTYHNSIEVELPKDYDTHDMRKAVEDMMICPNDVMRMDYDKLDNFIKSNTGILEDSRIAELVKDRDKHIPWDVDEMEVMEDF